MPAEVVSTILPNRREGSRANPVLNLVVGDIVAGRDAAALVEPSVELNDDLAGTVFIDDLELTDVAVLHHDLQELDDLLGGRPDEDLPLAALLGIVHGLEGIVKNADANHCCKFSATNGGCRNDRRRGPM